MSLSLSALDDRLELKGLLGTGGMGEVHRAWDRALERAVAVKFLRGADEREAERLVLEARLQARVEDPRVVRVHEVGTLGGRPCIVLQLVEGKSLADRAGALPLATRVELLRQAALGVHAAHRQGLVHRDVKPGNVLLDESSGAAAALVSDFGLARGEDGGLTRSGLPAGTLAFMAPEQVVGQPVDLRADVYSLGATLYAALAGAPPFGSGSLPRPGAPVEDPGSLLRRILEEAPPPLGADVPPELRRVVEKAMEKEPGQRYPTAEAFADDLGRFLRGEPVQARSAPLAERLLRWGRRNRLAARALAAAAAAILVGAGLAAWTSRRASLQALEAARLGAEAASLRSAMRMEHLLPPHDLRPALAEVRAEVEELRAGAAASAPAAFALGAALDLLGDLEGARDAYQRSWAGGHHAPEVAEGLGLVLLRLYRRDLARLAATVKKEELPARRQALQAALRDPALGQLALTRASGARRQEQEAQVALVEGDFARARALAAEARRQAPGRYELLRLEGEAWLDEAMLHRDEGRMPEGEVAAAAAVAPLEAAIDAARSDPELYRLRSLADSVRADLTLKAARDPRALVEGAIGWLERAERLDPDAPEVLIGLGVALAQQGQFELLRAGQPGPLLQRAVEKLARAAERAPGELRPRIKLARVSYLLAYWQGTAGQDRLPELRRGIAAGEEAVRLAPEESEARTALAVLRMEEGRTLAANGLDATAAIEAAVAHGRAALKAGGAGVHLARSLIGPSLVDLARQDWLAGRDPRPRIAEAVAAAEENDRALQGDLNGPGHLLSALLDGGDLLLAMGDLPAAHLDQARAVAERARRDFPGAPFFTAQVARVAILEAERAIDLGEDPGPAMARAAAALGKDPRKLGAAAAAMWMASYLPLLEARRQARSGADPTAAAARAEGLLAALARESPEDARLPAWLAESALLRARWLAGHGGAPAPMVRRGLAAVDQASKGDRREPSFLLLRARLLAAGGDPAGARAALDQALAINPRQAGGVPGRLAAAEVAAVR